MPASPGFRNTAFICGMESEARCLRAAGITNSISLSGANTLRAGEISRELVSAGADSLISIGLAGGLDPRLGPGSVIVAERVLSWQQPFPAASRRSPLQGLGSVFRQEDSDTPEEKKTVPDAQFDADPELRAQLLALLGGKSWSGSIVGVNRAVTRPAEKLSLYAQTQGLACDMESHAVAEAAKAAGIPFLVIRVVSDPSNRSIPQSALAGITPAGRTSPGRVLRSLSVRPWELFELLSLALDARIAFGALRRVARRSAPLFRAVG